MKTHYEIKELNSDVNKIINSYLPDPIIIPEDGTDDTRVFDAWLLTEEGKKWDAMDGESKCVHRNEQRSRVKSGIISSGGGFHSTGLEDEEILKWFINEKGELDNKYEPSIQSIRYKKKCCVNCGHPLPKNTPYWKTRCYPCWKGQLDDSFIKGKCLIVVD